MSSRYLPDPLNSTDERPLDPDQREYLRVQTTLGRMELMHIAQDTLLSGATRLATALGSNQTDALYAVSANARLGVWVDEMVYPHCGDDGERVLDFIGGVDDANVARCYSTLNTWDELDRWHADEPSSFRIILHSPGGHVLSGMRLYDHFMEMRSRGHKITTVVRGTAASMGAVILQAGDKRIMGSNAVVLVHELSGGAQGSVGQIADTVALMDILSDNVLQIFGERTKMTAKQIKVKMARTDWWMGAQEALDKGFIDEIG